VPNRVALPVLAAVPESQAFNPDSRVPFRFAVLTALANVAAYCLRRRQPSFRPAAGAKDH